MPLKFTEINDVILINLADNHGYTFSDPKLEGGCDDSLHTAPGDLYLPVYQSYKNNPSQGIQLRAKMSVIDSLLKQLFDIDLDEDPPIRITTWNANANIDVFPTAKSAVVVAETIRAGFPDVDFAPAWPDIVAGAIVSEMKNLKGEEGRGVGAKFTDAVNDAMYENQSPQQSLTSVMKLKTFCIQAGRGMLGLGTNGGGTPAGPEFLYNFGASLLFNPDLHITEKGKGRIYMTAKFSSGNSEKDNSPKEPICGKAIVIYNSTRGNSGASLSGSNLSFSFRPDDTFSDEEDVANKIMEAARTLTNTDITENQLAAAKMTRANWESGKPWTSDPVIIQGGLRYQVKLNAPENKGLGIFNVGFSCNFGTENGSLTLSNLLLSFTFDIKNYVSAVAAVQQMNARVREANNNLKSQLAARAAALAAANKTANDTPAPLTKVDLNSNLNTTTNYATRDQNVANTVEEGTNIFDNTTVPTGAPGHPPISNPEYNNDKEDARVIIGDTINFDII